MKKVFTIISVAALLLLAFSCKKNGYEIPEKYKVAEELSVKGSAHVEFGAAGGSQSLSVLHNSEAVAVKADAEWVNVTASDQKVIISCDENFALTSRYAQVTISSSGKSSSIQVKQNGVTNEYLWEESYSFAAAGGEVALKYLPTTLSIKLKVEGSEWITAAATDNTLKILVAKNETGEARTGKVTWQAGEDIREIVITQAKGNGGGGTNPPVVGSVIFSEDFEDADDLDGWLFADLDQDEHGWYYSSEMASHSGMGILFSESYDNATNKALTPDNWVVTPLMSLGTNNYVSFWVAGQDPDWVEEHYGVYVSLTLPETYGDLENFEELFAATNPIDDPYESETKSYQGANGVKNILWQRIAVKIPATYDNKSVCIGIRHFDCTDMFILNLDDVMVTQGLPEKTASSSVPTSTVKIDGNRSNSRDHKRR
ncbi:MAG: choice-of-anchor J domain-containing protein [Bacteroidales bacterium]|nr:choice-of-anchor J domain-containing protein [Bacteroidales bacterium]